MSVVSYQNNCFHTQQPLNSTPSHPAVSVRVAVAIPLLVIAFIYVNILTLLVMAFETQTLMQRQVSLISRLFFQCFVLSHFRKIELNLRLLVFTVFMERHLIKLNGNISYLQFKTTYRFSTSFEISGNYLDIVCQFIPHSDY